MHADELLASPSLVQRLIRTQFPEWGHLPVKPVASSGTDNAIFRLGDTMAMRLPRRPSAVVQVEKEQEWLPQLAPKLPLRIPEPLARGEPDAEYPWPWSVVSWMEGDEADVGSLAASRDAALALAGFIGALQAIDSSQGPPPGEHNSYRGAALSRRTAAVQRALERCEGLIDVEAAEACWQRALAAPTWTKAPVWLHGDLLPTNLLTKHGSLHAVIDFGMLGVGDPACDLLPAWAIFEGEARTVFRDALDVDDATWVRGRGWALSWGLIALPYYIETNRVLAEVAQQTIRAVLTDDA